MFFSRDKNTNKKRPARFLKPSRSGNYIQMIPPRVGMTTNLKFNF